MFEWLMNYVSIMRSVIIGAIFTAVIILGIFVSYLILRKNRDNKYLKTMLYAILFPLSIIMATLGMYSFARQRLTSHYYSERFSANNQTSTHLIGREIPIVATIFIIVIVAIALIYVAVNYLFIKNGKSGKNTFRSKSISLTEQVVRRIPIGIIGTLATNPGQTINGESGLILLILIYAFFDTALIYLEFREKYPERKAILFSLLGILIHYPLIILDAVLSNVMIDEFWWKPFVLISLGSIYIFNGIFKYLRGLLKAFTVTHEHYEFTEHVEHTHTKTKIIFGKNMKGIVFTTIISFITLAILLITI